MKKKKIKKTRRKREFPGFKDDPIILPESVPIQEEFKGFPVPTTPTPEGVSLKSKAPKRGDMDEETGLFYECDRDGYGKWVPQLGERSKRTNPKNYPRQYEISDPFEDGDKLGIIW
jgi:hypothetical protein